MRKGGLVSIPTPPESTGAAARLSALACEYHERMEAFDQLNCTGRTATGVAVPINTVESAAINKRATELRNALFTEASMLGFTGAATVDITQSASDILAAVEEARGHPLKRDALQGIEDMERFIRDLRAELASILRRAEQLESAADFDSEMENARLRRKDIEDAQKRLAEYRLQAESLN